MKLIKDRKKQEEEREEYYVASQWQLMWCKFIKHKLALIAGPVLVLLYFLAIFCEFISPYGTLTRFPKYLNAPPQRIHFFNEDKGFQLRPFVYSLKQKRDPVTFRKTFTADKTRKYPIHFFTQGETYKLWNLLESDLHLFDTEGDSIFLLGTDKLGRDLFSRIIYGSRISLSIGLVGVFLTFVFGLTLGGISGYFGGVVDTIVMRVVDLLISIPTIPLWMALAAALPRDWPVIKTYFAITMIFSVIGWTGLARVARGKLLALREEDFITAAKIAGATDQRIIIRHLLPSFSSYIIVNLTLAIPSMILGESALSFLGLGIQPPAVSWGTLLQDAQKLRVVAHYPWLLMPCLFVIVTVLMFNFLGDGLRDAADPYK
jgi:peptide/nickel transport system permease protein